MFLDFMLKILNIIGTLTNKIITSVFLFSNLGMLQACLEVVLLYSFCSLYKLYLGNLYFSLPAIADKYNSNSFSLFELRRFSNSIL